METNTLILRLEDYNELRDFKTNIQNNKTYVINGRFANVGRYISSDEAVKSIAEENKILSVELEKLRNLVINTEVTVNDLKKMSIWKFYKWKKS